jgi:hypothetical protein
MSALLICLGAFVVIAIAFAIHPGFGILVALISYGAVNGLLSKE